jgi:hypothetical protein
MTGEDMKDQDKLDAAARMQQQAAEIDAQYGRGKRYEPSIDADGPGTFIDESNFARPKLFAPVRALTPEETMAELDASIAELERLIEEEGE